jgi:hypothetical protein
MEIILQIKEALFEKKIAIGCNFWKNRFTFGLSITIYACPHDQSVILSFHQILSW